MNRTKGQWYNYRYWSIKFKLLTISAMFILCSVFLVSFLSYFQYTKNFEKQSADKVQQILEQVSLNIDTYLDDLFRLSLFPYRNDQVMNALENDENTSELYNLQKTWIIEDFLDEIMIFPRRDILRVFIVTDKNIYSSGRTQTTIDPQVPVHELDWYNQALKTQDSIFVSAHMEQMVKHPKSEVFSIVKQLRSTKDMEKILGVIKVDANYKGIEAIAEKVNAGKKGGLFIIDANKNLIYSSLTKKAAEKFDPVIHNVNLSNTKVEVNHEDYLLNSIIMPSLNWTIISVNSIKELNQGASHTRNIAFLMAVICAFLSIVVLFFFIKRFLNPLLEIVKLMNTIKRGNLSVSFPEKRHDEIGYLGSSFNEMVAKINYMLAENTKLVEEVYEVKLAQNEAQLNALFNQIKPHFIFNTLNMISLLMQSGKEERAVDHINKLSHIMRNITRWQKDVEIEHELELLHSYLSIQSSRFDGKLEYHIDIDPSLYSYRIPAFLLQPIVENAIIYGCELKRGKTQIHITHETLNGQLIIHVKDNGKGMDEQTLNRLKNKLDHQSDQEEPSIQNPNHRKGMGIGLININKRIKMMYGNVFGLTVQSSLDSGTCVKIVLPKEHERMEKDA